MALGAHTMPDFREFIREGWEIYLINATMTWRENGQPLCRGQWWNARDEIWLHLKLVQTRGLGRRL